MPEQSLVARAKSLVLAIGTSIKDGKVLADPETIERRAKRCLECPKLREKRGKYACVVCGCSFKTKIASHGSTCPLGHW